jgi:tRNA (uracil-5-)-methyltransferase TRM9
VDDATARALNRINAAFYGDPAKAAAFSATREGAWPGWQRLLEELEARGLPDDARVLDVGCGNARLGRFLAAGRPGLRYVGVDASRALLARARPGELGAAPRLLAVDLLEEGLGAALARHGLGRFDLVACFGVLHHVPGRARRVALLAGMLAALAPRGLLALTCWQLARFARFRDKTAPWSEAGVGLDSAQLEPGDHLLPFHSGGVRGLRYVHFAHEGETAELLAGLPCQTLASFAADGAEGNLNRYFVVRRV